MYVEYVYLYLPMWMYLAAALFSSQPVCVKTPGAGLLRLDHRQGGAAGGHFYKFECKLFSAPSVLGHG